MVFNLKSQAARRRAMLLAVRRQAAYERKLRRQVSGLFAQQGRAAAKAYKATGSPVDAARALATAQAKFKTALSSHYLVVAGDFAQEVFDDLKAAPLGLETKGLQEWFLTFLQNWVRAEAAVQVVNIQETTRKLLRGAIRVGIRQGEGQDGIARLILQRVGDMSRYRARVIARTETHNAAGFGQLEAAKSSGVATHKEWLSAEGVRTRTSHATADGQRREIEDAFDVGGARLYRPGDSTGPAREIINCRCTMTFHTE